MGYFWVNQGQTFKLEYQFECLWAPIQDKKWKEYPPLGYNEATTGGRYNNKLY